MANNDFGIPDDIFKNINERIDAFEEMMARRMESFFLCRHGMRSDVCAICSGLTAFGATADVVAEILRKRKLLTVELDTKIAARAENRPSTHRPNPLKTVIGAGIGVSIFLAFAGWHGGKFLLRLRPRDGKKNATGT